MHSAAVAGGVVCYHCGESCPPGVSIAGEKPFCCQGCKMVYQLLNRKGLCEYYRLNDKPGISQRIPLRKDKFAFLDDRSLQQKLVSFADDQQTHITLYLPQVHCSSCLYLLENLHKMDEGVISCRVNFPRREASIVFEQNRVSLRGVAELLTSIGYEPYISLNNLDRHPAHANRGLIYRLGVAGFCFANIMLLSFPEYLGLQETEKLLQGVFRALSFLLALPVFLYSAQPFYQSGWKGLKNKFLNIDAPIALAIIVTFGRSVYEVLSHTGSGYFDSMSGIVFFMLAGRVLQDKTYQQLSFERDFTSYFPIAVTVLENDMEASRALPDIKTGDTLLIHSEELVPADGILTRGKALVDYSFVTGESLPVAREMGEIVYAGGKQTGSAIEILVIKEVAQSYLTSLWSRDELKKTAGDKNNSFVHLLSRWFTVIVLTIAALGVAYWWTADSSKVWNVLTAVLIVACPCALLLSNTFTNGNVLRILGRNGFYLRGASVIESIATTNQIVFDKTGTLTTTRQQEVAYSGCALTHSQQQAVATLAAQSNHPLSKALVQHFGCEGVLAVDHCTEIPGMGIKGVVNGEQVALGSQQFILPVKGKTGGATGVYLAINGKPCGYFNIRNHYRTSIPELIRRLGKQYPLSVISGDNGSERLRLQQLLGKNATLQFNQAPEDKLEFIQRLQQNGHHVMMIGDGLNDAGALRQSDTGIAVAEDYNNFTPASDAIIGAAELPRLPKFIQLCKINKRIILASFALSIIYNIIGLFFAVQGALSPLVAAILMPCSSLSILLITFGCSNLAARWLKL